MGSKICPMHYLLLIDVQNLTAGSSKNCNDEQIDSFLTAIDNMEIYDARLGFPSGNMMMMDQEAEIGELLAERNLTSIWKQIGKEGLYYHERNTIIITINMEWAQTPFRKNVFFFEDGCVTNKHLQALQWIFYQMAQALPGDVRDFLSGWNRAFASGPSAISNTMCTLMDESLGSSDDDEDYKEGDNADIEQLPSAEDSSLSDKSGEWEKVSSDSDILPINYNSLLTTLAGIGRSYHIATQEMDSKNTDDKDSPEALLKCACSSGFTGRERTEGNKDEIEIFEIDGDSSNSPPNLSKLQL